MARRAAPDPDLRAMRQSYSLAGLAEGDLAADWVTQFRSLAGRRGRRRHRRNPTPWWWPRHRRTARWPADACCARASTRPGVVFYTNLTSDKSRDLQANPRAAATFPWIGLQRQVHFRGPVVRVSDETAKEYWATRPRGSRIGAWASPQSTCCRTGRRWRPCRPRPQERFGDADDAAPIPLPPFWGGWRIQPETVEFWQGRYARLHDRLRYRADGLRGRSGSSSGSLHDGPVTPTIRTGRVSHEPAVARNPAPDDSADDAPTADRPATRRRPVATAPTTGPGCAGSGRTPAR